jgi:hypothetical protein
MFAPPPNETNLAKGLSTVQIGSSSKRSIENRPFLTIQKKRTTLNEFP